MVPLHWLHSTACCGFCMCRIAIILVSEYLIDLIVVLFSNSPELITVHALGAIRSF